MSEQTLINNKISFKSELSKYLYLIRGIAIILVVIGHVIGYNITYGMRQIYNSDLFPLGWICDVINTFHMPTFFIASGIAFAAFSNKDISYTKFFTSKVQKLVIPLIIWCPPYFILQSLSKSKPFTALDVIASVIFPYQIFWFLHVLIFTTLLGFLYFKNFKSVNIYFLLSIGLFIISILIDNEFWQRNLFWNLFYAFGVVITTYLPKLNLLIVKNTILVNKLLPCLCLGIILVVQHSLPADAEIDYLRMINGIVGFSFLYLISSQLITKVEQQKSANHQPIAKTVDYFSYFGGASIAIYLFHGYFTGVTKSILLKIFILPHPVLYLILVSAMGIIGPVLFYEIFKDRSKVFAYSIGATK